LPLNRLLGERENRRGQIAAGGTLPSEGSNLGNSESLRKVLFSGDTLVMPDAYDPLSARIIESLGFKAVQCSGHSFALAACCRSEAELGFERNLTLTKSIIDAVGVPVMADGEDGFGGPPVVVETVRAFLRAGVAGINLEDQVLGQPGPRRVVDRGLMVEKIQAAREAARQEGTPDVVINGRTDALAAAADRDAGLKESIARANLYLEAGADLAFVVGVATIVEARTLVKRIHGPLSVAAGLPYNIDKMSIGDLIECGVARISLPTVAIFSAIQAITRTLTAVRNSQDFSAVLREQWLCSSDMLKSLAAVNPIPDK
jgi:2-methylisocitrate lyase-like PEP mutase family enzyme